MPLKMYFNAMWAADLAASFGLIEEAKRYVAIANRLTLTMRRAKFTC